MQLSSMTGFARNQGELSLGARKFQWVWEIRSVNAKGMDFRVRLPQWLDELDAQVKAAVSKVLNRGSFVVNLDISSEETTPQLGINHSLLEALIEQTKEIYQKNPEVFQKSSPAELLRVGGVLKLTESDLDEQDKESLKQALCQGVFSAAEALKTDRLREGKKIASALTEILKQIKEDVLNAEKIASGLASAQRQKITKQIGDLASDVKISPERLEQEIVLLAMRADVQEEIDRLKAHIKNAEELFESREAVGRRLDFLCQEFNREANTLCSKSTDIELTRLGMDLKAAIEQFREQVQNVE